MIIDDKICAIIVTYNPDKGVIFNVRELHRQVKKIVIVDNGSNSNSKKYIEQIRTSYKCKVIYNNENLGIATALNVGVRYAIKHGYKWVATFDQDSTVTPNMLENMMKIYDSFPSRESLAIISPKHRDKNLIKYETRESFNRLSEYHSVMSVMTSGNLIKIDVFDKIGLFNDDLFIDYVDHEFCFRCQMNKLQILEADNAVLNHREGYTQRFYFIGKRITITNHNYLRRYYKSRNRIYMYKNFFKIFPRWVLFDIKSFISETIGIIFFEDDKIRKIHSIIRGTNDGLKNRLGRMS